MFRFESEYSLINLAPLVFKIMITDEEIANKSQQYYGERDPDDRMDDHFREGVKWMRSEMMVKIKEAINLFLEGSDDPIEARVMNDFQEYLKQFEAGCMATPYKDLLFDIELAGKEYLEWQRRKLNEEPTQE